MNRKKTKDLLRRAWHTNMKNLPVTPFHRNNINKSRYKRKKVWNKFTDQQENLFKRIQLLNSNHLGKKFLTLISIEI